MIEIGVTLPTMLPATDRAALLAWGRAIDGGPFASLAAGERVLYESLDPLVALAVCAAATKRCELMTAALVAPLHDPVLLAKQLACLDRLSEGRLTAGVAPGSRPEDFALHPERFHDRHERLVTTARRLRELWARAPVEHAARAFRPHPSRPNGPPLLVATASRRLICAMAAIAEGVIAWTFDGRTEPVAELFRAADEAWRRAGRRAAPRKIVGRYFALGPRAREKLERFLDAYHGGALDRQARAAALRNPCAHPQGVRDTIAAFRAAGADQLLLSPADADLSQLERLAEVVA